MVVWKRHIQPYLSSAGEFNSSSASEQNQNQLEVNAPTCGQKRGSSAKVLLKIARKSLESDDETSMDKTIQDHFLGELYGCIVNQRWESI